jgi:hypothetical protein
MYLEIRFAIGWETVKLRGKPTPKELTRLRGPRTTGAVALASFPTVQVSLLLTPAQSPVRWPQLPVLQFNC